MSRAFYLVGESPRANPQVAIAAIKKEFASIRLVASIQDNRVCLEPFDGPSSFAALLGIRKYRDDTLEKVRQLALALFRWFEVVLLEVRDEHTSASICSRGPIPLANALLKLPGRASERLVLEAPPMHYFMRGIEATLFRPLDVSDGGEAIGFFCDYDVVAADLPAARRLVASSLALEGAAVAAWGKVEVAGVVEGAAPSAVRVGGRIYFGGR